MTGFRFRLAGALMLTAAASCAFVSAPSAPAQARVRYRALQTGAVRASAPIDESRSVTLYGNTHPLAQPANDEGQLSADTTLSGMVLSLQPTTTQESALDALLAAQQDPASPLYHRWLAPAEFGARFGASAQSIAQVRSWLSVHGFTVDQVAPSGRFIVFSGTAAQVEDAFHTEIHRYSVDGSTHIANVRDPQIPAVLASIVAGVVTLHDFRSASTLASRTRPGAQSTSGGQPMYSAGSTHYLFPADFATIYNLNSLYADGLTGSGVTIAIAGRSNIQLNDVASFRSLAGLAVKAPTVVLPSTDPGLGSSDQDEATLDVEWAGAVAPAASITLVAAPSTSTTDGIDLAAAYIVNHAIGSIVSVSYSNCESRMGSTELAFYNALWKQAAAQGQTVLVASGDSGAAACQAGSATKSTSAAVNGICSSPYATCVGGTQFNEGSGTASYWSSTNSAAYGSVLSYIPEIVWNESASSGGTGLWASGGGVSSTYTQPSWQASVSGASAANGMRAVPDVSLAAAAHDGSMIVEGGTPYTVSGTSFAAPSMAGIFALVVQKAGAGQGSVNARLYQLADSTPSAFHPTPSGSNTVPGVYGYTASGATYNLATGLGSVDGSVLVQNWTATTSLVQCSASVAVSTGCLLSTPIHIGVSIEQF